MKIPVWNEALNDKEVIELAYQERNLLALRYADGWYTDPNSVDYNGWGRVLSLDGGRMTFHIPDSFPVGGNLKEIEPNWDGHTTKEKWIRVLNMRGIEI